MSEIYHRRTTLQVYVLKQREKITLRKEGKRKGGQRWDNLKESQQNKGSEMAK